jgi:hypothetical protein
VPFPRPYSRSGTVTGRWAKEFKWAKLARATNPPFSNTSLVGSVFVAADVILSFIQAMS